MSFDPSQISLKDEELRRLREWAGSLQDAANYLALFREAKAIKPLNAMLSSKVGQYNGVFLLQQGLGNIAVVSILHILGRADGDNFIASHKSSEKLFGDVREWLELSCDASNGWKTGKSSDLLARAKNIRDCSIAHFDGKGGRYADADEAIEILPQRNPILNDTFAMELEVLSSTYCRLLNDLMLLNKKNQTRND